MKKKFTLCIFSIAFLLSATHGQVTRGEKFIGGTVSIYWSDYNNSPSYDASQTSLYLTPKLGFPLNHSWVIGPLIGYGYTLNKSESGQNLSEQKSNSFTTGGFIRKFHSFNEMLGIFAEMQTSYAFGNNKYRNESNGVVSDNKSKTNVFSIGAKPGIYFKPGHGFLIEATLGNVGYSEVTEQPDGGEKVKSKQFSASLSNYLSFGLQFILK